MKRIVITAILTLALTAFAIQAVEQTAFSGAGIVESTSGGFKFPDGSVQLSAITPPCTAITSLPYVIDESGVYCFTGNLDTDLSIDPAIRVEADDVVIDLNGWRLDGSVVGSTTGAAGVWSTHQENITIRNGTIRGFKWGVWLSDGSSFVDSRGHLIENILFDSNTWYGILVEGTGNIVRNNRVINTGTGDTNSNVAWGITLKGPSGRILNNDIITLNPRSDGNARGISIDSSIGSVVKNNRIEDARSTAGFSYGVAIDGSDDILVIENQFTNLARAIDYRGGSTGKYMDNLTANVGIPFTGGTPVGIND